MWTKALPDVASTYTLKRVMFVQPLLYLLLFLPISSHFVLQPKSYLRSCSYLGKMLKPSQQFPSLSQKRHSRTPV